MSATATATVTRIYQRQRDDQDTPVWVEVDRFETRCAADVALTKWLHDQDEPLAGDYRAENDRGSHAETTWRSS